MESAGLIVNRPPAIGCPGMIYYATDEQVVYRSDGSTWTALVGSPEAVITPTLLNGWIDFGAPYGPVRYYKHGGRVFLSGLAKNPTASAIPAVVFNLPAGYRPASTKLFIARNGANTVPSQQALVAVGGDVSAGSGAANVYQSFDGLSFRIGE